MSKWRSCASVWAVFWGISGIAACRGAQTPPEANTPPLAASASSATAEAGSAAALLPANPLPANPSPGNSAVQSATSARATDERWLRASGEDLADKQALADALGAAGLLEALDDGGNIALTALLCLPLAEDADEALGPLAARLSSTTNDARELYLTAILAIAGRPARAREMVDPEGAARAGEVLLGIAKNEALPWEHRALAISAARALAEKKWVDPAKIPTDLDPP